MLPYRLRDSPSLFRLFSCNKEYWPGLKWPPVGGVSQDMSRALRLLVILLVLFCGVLPARAVQGAVLERGAAITDPYALRELELGEHPTSGLDHVGFGVPPLIPATRNVAPILDHEPFSRPPIAPVTLAIDS